MDILRHELKFELVDGSGRTDPVIFNFDPRVGGVVSIFGSPKCIHFHVGLEFWVVQHLEVFGGASDHDSLGGCGFYDVSDECLPFQSQICEDYYIASCLDVVSGPVEVLNNNIIIILEMSNADKVKYRKLKTTSAEAILKRKYEETL